ncbi:mucin-5B [Macaca nemestrina]|uniref:mucin-5B n=1 Tax=Macaca nemestrina TaxID=9545 RepID=UPI0039B952D2
MGALSTCRTLVLALAAVLLVQQAETQGPAEPSWGSAGHTTDGGAPMASPTRRVSFVPPVTVFPSLSPLNPAHNGRVCSTWGDFHYKTFDGDVFRFPGLCNYVFSEHCGAAYEDFNVQLRRGLVGSRPVVTRVVIKAQGLVLEASNGSVLVNGQREELPYSRTGLLVEQSGDYVKVSIRLVLTFLWNGEDSALLELDPKYANQTCGLCGDFNSLPAFNEFYAHNARLTPLQFGNLQKLDGPTEQCPDPLPLPASNCTDEEGICHHTLLGPAFAECHALVDTAPYLAACAQDLCRCPTCPCATFVEYSRQCAHAGGQPQNWRRPELCSRTCPVNMQHQECGSPCVDTCSNPQRAQLCEDHCVDGCFCPPGMVLDDVTHSGCLPLGQCPCTHGGRTYSPGASVNTTCSSCTCSGGLWQCQDLPCPGTCSVQGGAHITTYDEKLYDLHGDCSYVLSKKCADGSFTVLAELRKCGLTDNENCLKAVTLSLDGGDTAIRVQADGSVFLNSIYTQLPLSAANITLFTPSSFFIVVHTGLGLQLLVQLVPLMQVFVRLDPAHQGQMCGLCGNFNQNQADDFAALSGVVEATGAAFANTWKAQAACANARNSFEDPCSLSVENENYARHWCSRLTDPTGSFSRCHSVINPKPFHSNCLFDTCNCERSEDCLCAALSSYVHACAAKGVQLSGWRDGVCTKYMQNCPKSQSYAYVVDACQPTCRGLSEADVTCSVSFVPVDGCTCPTGTFLNDAGACVPARECPCYVHGTVLAPGEVVHDEGAVCSCEGGKLSCLGASLQKSTGCVAPMVYLNCSNSLAGTPGAECLRSCHTLDVGCFSTHCVSGCVCPPGLVSDGSGGCIAEEDCPCVHNEATYKPGDTIRVDCNTCTCRNRRWECSHRLCLGTCVAYGDGHFITFDGERYSFEGSCEYILAQDYCGDDATHGTFRIVTENIPCGTTGTTCSKAIKLFVESYELILQEGAFKAVARGPGGDPPYKIRYMGIFLVIETRGMAVSWDRKTSVFIRLHQDYKGRVCGLCGNFDDHAINDFATRSRSVVGDALEFGNSWKLSPSCPDALAPKDPCTANPFRKSWAQKQCSILHGPTFAACRSQVDSTKYYEACVNDACACDSGGDCECFCTAVAAYAQACHDAGLCVSWRTPDTCPLFCDFYNPHGGCEWHYQPCGAPCLKTCRNPSGHCLVDLPGLEGCYPTCPPSQPFFNEDQMKCVAQCGCYDRDGNYYDVGARVPTAENCQSCNCTPSGIQCAHSLEACTCTYEDRTYGYQDVIYNTTDGLGACLIAICGSNGTIVRKAVACPGTPATTPFTFTTSWVPHSTTSPALPVSTVCVREVCRWSSWYNGHHPEPGLGGGDFETFENLRQRGYQVCPVPADIECRAGQLPDMPLGELGQQVDCDRVRGLMCANSQQSPPLCHDYELRVLCCEYVPCGPSLAPGTSPQPSLSASTEPAVPTPTQTTATEKTTLWVIPSIRSTAALTSQTGSSSGPTTVTSLAPGTTICQPRCQWTEWFDEDYPKSEQLGGDVESYDKIRAAGGHLCEQPKDIECQAESFPNWPLAQVGQKVHCDVRFGLVCRNWEQEGIFKMCYNYRIRVLCCSADHCRGRATTPPPATSLETATTTTTTQVLFSTLQSTSSLGVTSTTAVPTLSKGLTSPRYTGTLGTATTGGPTVPAGSTEPTVPGVATSNLPTHSVLPGTTGSSGTWRPSQPPTPAPTTMATSRAHLTGTASSSSKQPLTTSLAPTLSSELFTSQAETSTPRTETTLSRLTETTTSQSTTRCQPKCEWTEWFDVDFPTSGVAGGDMETFENIRAAGGKMCWAPKSIECRAENYPEVSIDQIGQVLTCSLETGLICKNEDQTGRFNMCFNYNVRVLCCDDYSHCPRTAATGSTATSSSTPGTTWILTEPTTTLTTTVATSSTVTPSSTPATAATSELLTTMATKPTATGSKVTPSTSPGTAPTLPVVLTSTATTPTATSFTAIPSSSLRTTWNLTAQTTTPTATLSTAHASSTPRTTHPSTALTTTATTTQATGSTATLLTSEVLTTMAITTSSTATPSSSPGTASTLTALITTTTTPKTSGYTVTPSSIPGTTHTPTVLTNTTTIVATGSMATPSSSPQTTGTPPALATTGTTITATGSTTTLSSTPGTTPISPVLTTTATTPAATSTTVAPSSALGTTHTPPVLSTTATTHGQSQLPESPRTVPTARTSTATSGTTHITEPSTVTSHTPVETTGTNPHSNSALSSPHTHSRTTESPLSPGKTTPGLTTATSRTTATATTSKTHTSTLLPSSPTSAPTTPVVSTGCEPQCAWSDWLDYSYPMSGTSGGDLETYSNIRAAGGAVCEQPLGLECRAQAQPGVPLQELGQVVECSLDFGLVCRNRQQVGKFKMCFNYEIRVFCCNYGRCPSTPATSSTAIPSSTPGTTWILTEPSTTATITVATGSTAASSSTPGTTWILTEPTTTLTTTVATSSTVTPSSTPATAATSELLTTIATKPTATGSKATPSTSPGTASTLPVVLTSTATTPTATSFTAIPSSSLRTTWNLTAQTTTPTATLSTAHASSTPRTTHTSTALTTMATTTQATGSTATLLTSETAHTSKVLTTMAITTSSTATPSSSPGTASTLTALITTTTTPKTSGYTVTPSSIPGTTHIPTVLTNTTTTVATGSMATPTSSPQTAGTPPALATTGTTITATGSTTTLSSTPGTTPISPVLTTTATTPAATSTTVAPSSALGTTHTPPVLSTTATTHGRSQLPESPRTVPTARTSVATSGTTHITEPSTVTSHTPVGTTGTNPHSTPAPSRPHTHSRTTESPLSPGKTIPGLTTATSRTTATATTRETRTSTLLPSSPTSAPTTPVVSTGCEPQCAWSDWLDYSYPMSGPSGGDLETYSNIRAAGGAVCEQPLGLECRAQAQPGVPLRELGQVVECSLDFGLVCRNRQQVGKFKMCFNYEIRVFCCNYGRCPSTPATSSMATPSSTLGSTWILTEPTTTAITTVATGSTTIPSSTPGTTAILTEPTTTAITTVVTGSTAIPSSTPGTTWILTEPSTTATITVATGSTAASSSTPGTTWILTEPTTTLTTTVATGSTVTPSSTPATAATSELLTTIATKPTATGSKATPSTSPGTASTLPVVLTSTATTPTATSFTAIPSSSLRTTWNLTAPTATLSTAHASSTPRTTHTSTALTTTATTTQATGSTATLLTSETAHTSKVLTTMAITTSSTATPSSSPGTASTLTALITTNTTPTTSGYTVTPSSIPGTTHTPRVLTNTTTTVATGSMATPSSSLQTTGTPPALATTGTTITATSSTTTPSSTPGTTPISPVLTTTATTPAATSTTVAPSSALGTTHTPPVLSTTATTHGRSQLPESPRTVPTARTSMATSGTTHITEPSTVTSHTPVGTTGTTPHSTPALSSPHTHSRTTESPLSPGKTTPGLTTATSRTTATATTSETHTSTLLPSSPTSAPTTPVVSTGCEPQCAWSDWLDYSYPMSGPSGGDLETYSNIRAAGGAVCEQPLGLECRAQAQPSVPLRELGQVVECSLDFGLVCRNRQQVGKFKMCFNYEIRVFCCNYGRCPSTPATSSTATPSSTLGSTWILTEPTTTATMTAATGSTANPSSTPGTTWILTEPSTTATITVATGSTATPSSTPASTWILTESTTTAITTVATGSMATPSSTQGTTGSLTEPTNTATITVATRSTAMPSSTPGTTSILTEPTTTAITTVATGSTATPSSTPGTASIFTEPTTTATITVATGSTAIPSSTPGTEPTTTAITTVTTGSTATPSSTQGTTGSLTEPTTTTVTTVATKSTATPSSTPGKTSILTEPTTTAITTVATGSTATPSTPGTTGILTEPTTTAITTVTTGSTATPSSTPGTTRILTEPTTTTITTVATRSTATPSSTLGTTGILTEPTTTAITTVATGSTAMPSTPGTTGILTEPTTTAITTVATGSTAMPSTPGTTGILTEPTTTAITTVVTGSTATPSSTLGTTGILTEPTTTAITTVVTGSTAMPSSTLGPTRIQTEPATTATITVATSSTAMPSSTPASTWILTEPTTTAITTVATGSTATPSSTQGTTWILTEPTTTTVTTVATKSTATPSSTPGKASILTEPTTTAITTVATGSTATPSTPGTTGILTEPTTTAITTVTTGSTATPSSTPGTTRILTEPTTTTITTVTTGSTATPSSTPGTTRILTEPTTTTITTVATRSTATPSSTPGTTGILTEPTTTAITTVATGSTAMPATPGTTGILTEPTTTAITTVVTGSTATPSSTLGTTGILTEPTTTAITTVVTGSTAMPSSTLGPTRIQTEPATTATITVATSSTAMLSSTPASTWILTEPTTTAITTVATGSTATPSSTQGTTGILTEPTTTTVTTVATKSTATPSSTPGKTSILTEPTTTAITTVATGSTATPSTPGTTGILTEPTTTAITTVTTGSTATPSSTPGTTRILTEPTTTTITTVATRSTATPSSTPGTTGILTELTTTAITTVAMGSTAIPATPGTTGILTEPTTTAITTVATAMPSSTPASTWILTEPTTTAITTVATGSTAMPSSTPGTTTILTELTTTAITTAATGSTATPSSTPGTTLILTEPTTIAITTVAPGSTATPSSTPGTTGILTEPTTTAITTVATGSTAMPSTPGTTGILTEPTTTAITTVVTGSTATPSSTLGTTGILTEPTTTAITTVVTGSTAMPSSTLGPTRIQTEPATTATITVATSSTAMPSSTPASTWILTEPTTTAITTVATGSTATPSSTQGTTGILTEPTTTTVTTVATKSTATPSSTPGKTSILTEPTTTAITTVPTTTAITTVTTGSTATPSSTPGTTRILTEPTTTTITTVATRSTATPSSTPGTTGILTEPTTTAITTVATGSTAMPSSTLGTTRIHTEPATTATITVATSSTATPSSTPGTTGFLTEPTTTATITVATGSMAIPSSTPGMTSILTEPTTTAITTVATAPLTSTPGTTYPPKVLTITATTPTATSSKATPSSTQGTTWILTEPTTLATPTEATGSAATIPTAPSSSATPFSSPGTTGTLPVRTTTATTTMATRSTAIPSSTVGTAGTPKVLTTTATRPTATGSTVPSSSTLGTTHTPAVLTSSLPAFSVSTVSSSVLTTLRPTHFPSSHFSTPCFCRAFGQFFSPGEVIYNRTDRAGCQFYAVCNQHCDLDRFQGTCPTSPPPASSTLLPSPSPVPGCDNAIPSRQVNETWTLENCTVARCVGDNRVALLDPKPMANVTCVNKHLPIKVSDPSQPCDFHYECECICSVWGSSHYSTFDGTSYTFEGNCTYVLMREIHARLGNLSLYLDNHYCAASAAAASCSRALRLHYKSMDIVLTVTTVHGKEEDLILFDQIPVSSGFSKNGVLVSVTGTTTMRVDIPALGVSVTFDGHIFQARLPYSLFHNNTEGQCGTCTNNQRDDCLQRDGTTATSCKDMAKTWLVPDNRKDGCWAPTGTPPTASPPAPVSSAPTPSPCPPQPLCDLMLSQVFAECHDLVPPGPFFNACISDGCQGRPEVPCQSLEAYAALCRARGVCSDWRGATGGLCDLTCPPTKVYKPCGPIQPASCNSRNQNPQLEGLAEGCFCPGDQILFSAHTGICMQDCPCVGPDGLPKSPGQQWISNCQSCVCDEGSMSVQCKPLPCEAQGPSSPCSHPGFVTVTRPRADNPCCPETVCVCNTSTCHQSPRVCPPGQELISTQKEGDCCSTFLCRPQEPQLCSYNGIFYGVGAIFPGALPCHTCTCLSGDTQDPTVQCREDACHNTTCPQGFEYKRAAGQCCGECVQTACLTPDGPPVQLNETWVNSRVDNCTVYHCEVESGVYLLTPQPASCPEVSSCRGSLRKTGCCYSCEEDSCQVRVNTTVLWHQGCKTEVNITFCEGSCPGESRYSAEAQAMQHQCTCCQERRVHEETVPLRCPDGSTVLHTYNHVDECGCTPFCVPAPMAPIYPPGFLAQEATAV